MSAMGPFVLLRRRTAVIILGFSIFAILLTVWFINTSSEHWNNFQVLKMVKNSRFFLSTFNKNDPSVKRTKNMGLILDTPGCKIPKLDPFDPSIVELYEARDPYPCPGPPIFLYSQPDGSIELDVKILKDHYFTEMKDIVCAYQAIRRKYEDPGNVRENDIELMPFEILQFGKPLMEDYVVVECLLNKTVKFTHYFPLVYHKKDVEEKKSGLTPPQHRLNLIVSGVDSISKLNFLRHFKKTRTFMKKKGTFFDMKGYTKVGDNTFPNLTPLLTGRSVDEIWNETLKDTMFFDDVDFIWKRFAQKGYRTFYAEDSPYYGTYNYGRRGFNETPTDYYLRPLYLAMHNSELRNKGPWYCFNSVLETEIIYSYLKDLVKAMTNRPYFAFNMVSALTHDYFNHAGYADYPTVNLLEELWDSGAYNNSVIILFGDHGLRFGSIGKSYIGKFEERMPFLFVHFPTWFLEQNPLMAHHLHTNQNRLTTLFDMHATMIHLLYPELSQDKRSKLSPHGLSIMEEISPYRTCVHANILPHWCACQVFSPVSVLSVEAVKSAEVIIKCMNNVLRPQDASCPEVEVDSITSVTHGQLNELVLYFVRQENIVIDRSVVYGNRIVKYQDFVITLIVNPNEEIFECTVRHDVVDNTYNVVDILEIDNSRYGNSCLNTSRLNSFSQCYE